MATSARLGDVGVPLRLTIYTDGTPRDLSGATTLEMLLKKPGGTIISKPAKLTTDGTDGKMEYVTGPTDLDEVGTWRYQAHIVDGAQDVHSTTAQFEVMDVLKPT